MYKTLENTKKFLEDTYGLSLKEIEKNFGYSDEILVISQLEDNEELRNLYPKTFKYLEDASIRRDNRTELEYAQSLISGWLIEDFIMRFINRSKNYFLMKSGSDSDRTILGGKSVTCNSDFMICTSKGDFKMEFIMDTTGYWKRNGVIDSFRLGKLERLKSERALILCLDMINKEIAVIDSEDVISKKIYNKYLNKECSAINIRENNIYFNKFNNKNIDSTISRYIEKRLTK